MSNVFISHVEEDADIALEVALGLEEAGFSTWCYEVDCIPGLSYLIQTGEAIEASDTVVVLISPHSVGSRQVTKEVVRAHESGKEFIPVLRGITHVEFQNRQPEWREAIGAAASIGISSEGVAAILPRIINGLRHLDIVPNQKVDTARITQIRRTLAELGEHDVKGKAGELTSITGKAETEPVGLKIPAAKTAEGTREGKKWTKPAVIASSVVVVVTFIIIIVGPLLNKPVDIAPAPATVPAPTTTPSIPATTTTVPAATREASILFTDDFESGGRPEWKMVSFGGDVRIGEKAGNQFADCNDNVNYMVGSTSWTDYTVKAKVLLVGGAARICFRWQDPVETEQGKTVDTYVLYLSQDNCDFRRVKQLVGGSPEITVLVSDEEVQLEPDIWSTINIDCKENKLYVNIDGVKIMQYTDDQYPLLSGLIAVGTFADSHAYFDDIEVKKIIPTPSTPSEAVATPEPAILFDDYFQVGTKEDRNIIEREGVATINEKDNNRFLDCKGNVVYPAGKQDWTDYTLKAKVFMLEGRAILRIRQHLIGKTPAEGINTYQIALSPRQCALRKILTRPNVDPQITDLVAKQVQIKPNIWHNVAFTCKGNALSLDIDEVRILEHIDEKDPILSGSVMIGTLPDSHVLFDDIEVRAIAP